MVKKMLKKKESSGVRFIRMAIKKPGALSRQLGIPIEENIPFSLLNAIIAAKAGDIIKNPTKMGKRRIKVTRLIERRSILARTIKRLQRQRRGKF